MSERVRFNHATRHLLACRGLRAAVLLATFLEVPVASAQSTGDPEPPSPDASSPPSTAPVHPGGSANDSEEPVRPRTRGALVPRAKRVVPRDNEDEYGRPPRNPVWGVMFVFGFGGGGSDLVKVALSDGSSQTLSAGDGIDASLGLMWTPLWMGDALGVGISGTAGYKGWSVGGSNGDISIGRFPFTAALHVMPRVAHNWLLMARGGISKELDVSISCSGVISCTDPGATANLGWFGEGGFYYTFDFFNVNPDLPVPEQHSAFSLTGRYTKLTYASATGSVDASSFMIYTNFYYNP